MKKKSGIDNTLKLWHGTSKTDPRSIIATDAGLNINYSSDDNLWGKGIYFAVNASYSCLNYSHKIANQQNTYEVFLCEVVIGESKMLDLNPQQFNKLKEPPINPVTQRPFDSVKGNTNGSNVYIVY